MSIDEQAKILAAADWVIIAAYFVLCVTIGLWSKFRRQRGRQETAETYFLAGRSMMWWAVGPSLFASNIGSEHFIGLAGSGAATGVGVGSYEWEASWFLLILGWVFVPIYLKSRVYTMPEYLNKRFQSKSIRTVITIVALISCVFTKTSVDIYAGSVFLYEAIGWNIYWSSLCVLAITAIYTMLGGLMAVIFTDILQCVIMIVGAVVLAIISEVIGDNYLVGFLKVGGIDGLWERFPDAVGSPYLPPVNQSLSGSLAVAITSNSSNQSALDACFKVTPYWGNMFRPINDPDYPWLGLLTTLPILEVWYWCTDQVIVQRALSAKNTTHAKAGTILAALLKILPMFIMVMPGMISRVLFKDSIGCADKQSCKLHCDNEYGCTNNAYPKLVLNVLPVGLVGLMMAVMMAALMSSLSSAFNSSATVFTVDVWDRVRPKASQREQLIVGRVCVFLMVALSLCWLPIIKGAAGSQLFVYLQTVQSYLASPLTATYTLGILWPGLTESGALSGLAVGFFLGLIKFIMGNVYPKPPCGGPDDRPDYVKMHFMFYAIIVFGVVVIVMITVSKFTQKIPRDQLGGLTWSTIDEPPLAQSPTDIAIHLEEIECSEKVLDEKPKDKEEIEDIAKPKDRFIEREHLIKLEVVQFPEETPVVKWSLRTGIFLVFAILIFLWIWFR